ncbi:MAG: phosphatidate cytidylyltransferase, partial [Acidobacteriota bacterium]
WVWAYRSGWVVPFTLLGGFLILAWGVLESMRGSMEVGRGFPSASANLMAVFYLGWPFSILTVYHPLHDPALYDRNRPLELVLVLVTLWVSDSGAYFVGRAWGRHKVTPLISPNKSLEGYLSGLLLSLLAATLYGRYFFPSWPLLRLPALALVICLAGFLGDLFESLLKRGARVNDSSHLLPGHGGILDRVDSLLFALPAYYLFSILII